MKTQKCDYLNDYELKINDQLKTTKEKGSLIITADSDVSMIEETQRVNISTFTFSLTTPGRILNLFASRMVRI